ncbi:MAG: metallophosphoesterase [Bacilli bacterium]|jgi:hypothetical protein|nr:metallophosphoesterase [Bacilli bacterium]
MKKEKQSKKKFKVIYKILLISIILISLLLWSRYISTSGLIIKEYKVTNKALPTHFHGLKIVHISDIHYGRTIKEPELKMIVKKINLIKPDIVVFTGDLIDKSNVLTKKEKNIITEQLTNIKTTYGKYAVSGNHDFYFKEYNDILNASNFKNIGNDYDIIYNEQQEFIFIGGLESEINGSPNINKTMHFFQIEENKNLKEKTYKVLIMHTTDIFEKVKQHNFELVLGGHSHNGQVRLPFIGTIVAPKGSKKYFEPYYKIKDTDFFISGGLGTSTLNFRLFNKPSFNFYRLTKH